MKSPSLLAIFSTLFVVIQAGCARDTGPMATFHCEVDGITYVAVFSGDRIEKSPEWRDDQPNPPVSVRDAMSAAKKELPSMVGKPSNWQVKSVMLVQLHERTWVYKVFFYEKPWIPVSMPKSIFIVVPMDGTAIHPEIIKPKGESPPK